MIDLEWVSDYIDISDQDPNELAVKITKAGINVEKVINNHIDNLVIGQIISCKDHPDSDHLHVCSVDVSGDVKQIVCGAPNVRVGLKVIVALPGAILPMGFVIKSSKIRGVESDGMLCALFELGLEEKTEENYNKGICELGDDAVVGEDPISYLKLNSCVYELDIHKHRNNDCYYHIGFAYEIASVLNRKVVLPDDKYKGIDDNICDHFSLKVDTDKCCYYLAKMVRNAKIGESPDFIKRRLANAGMRSINNIVDISNYVMLEYGQPLHFFDYDKLGNSIVVRDARDNEEIVTLDGKLRVLKSSDIVITDGKKPVCIAGVMGGENTEVDDNTKNILIEAAIFDSVSIRNTANYLDLKSEASIRYGKGLSYEYTNKAINRACYLLEKYANAQVLSGIVSYDCVDKKKKVVSFVSDDINKMLGITISNKDMKVELERLGFDYKFNKNKFEVVIPSRRLDIEANVNDIAEEIGRLYGYHNLVSTLPKVSIKRGEYVGDVKWRKAISKRLRSLSLNECKTYTLVSSDMAARFNYENVKQVVLPNPLSVDKSVVRSTVIPSLINVYNYNRKRGVSNINLYEISKTYDYNYNEDVKISVLMSGEYIESNWQGNGRCVDFYLIKGILENLFNYLGFKNRYEFVSSKHDDMHPGICADVLVDRDFVGIIGKVHPSVSDEDIYVLEISMNRLMNKKVKALKYKEISKFPGINKDLAFIVDKDVLAGDIIKTIRSSGGRNLESISVFDVYTGKNIDDDKKSIAFNLLFEDKNRTLTDEEVNKCFRNIIDKVVKKHNAVLRDS